MAEQFVLSEVADHVMQITLNRPEKKNAFNNAMYLQLAAALEEGNKSSDVHVILITGSGDSFTAGQDISELKMPEEGAEIGFEKVFDKLEQCSKPVGMAVHGLALGFGLTLPLHADEVFVAESARFKLPFLPLGVVPEAASSVLLPLRVGIRTTLDWIYSARWITAQEIAAAGLASEVLADDVLLDTARAWATKVAAMPPEATQAARELVWGPLRESIRAGRQREGDAFRERLGSPENLEAIAAFMKR